MSSNTKAWGSSAIFFFFCSQIFYHEFYCLWSQYLIILSHYVSYIWGCFFNAAHTSFFVSCLGLNIFDISYYSLCIICATLFGRDTFQRIDFTFCHWIKCTTLTTIKQNGEYVAHCTIVTMPKSGECRIKKYFFSFAFQM